MKNPYNIYHFLFLLTLAMIFFAGCEELKKEPPEKLNPVNPLDPQYSESSPSPEEISSMDVEGPALILHGPTEKLERDYVFSVHLLAKDMDNIIGISANLLIPPSARVVSVVKDSTYFSENADGMAFYSTRIEKVNENGNLNISITRLGGSTQQGFTGNCTVATIIAKITTEEDAIFAFEKTGICQLRDVQNDTITLENLKNTTIEIK